eukprot:6207045-Pleurochrysis_carterae.AAC.3
MQSDGIERLKAWRNTRSVDRLQTYRVLHSYTQVQTAKSAETGDRPTSAWCGGKGGELTCASKAATVCEPAYARTARIPRCAHVCMYAGACA